MEIVSRETLDGKLSLYVSSLLKWQKTINLISDKSEKDVWQRHIDDSLQLEKFIFKQTKTIIDVGSGAGLPGVPLAIITGIKTYLVESDMRKCVFLRETIRQLQIEALVINQRIENARLKNIEQPVVITARALASLDEIFNLTYSLLDNNNIKEYKLLLLKGKNVSRETFLAEENWKFTVEYVQSDTNKEAAIMIITELEPR